MKLFLTRLAVILSSATVGLAANQIKVSSPAFNEGSSIPSKFTCDGSGTSPPFKIEGVDASAKSLVLIVDDPDAPAGVFTHWLVWNIDPTTLSIGEGKIPGGIQGRNDFGKSGYAGPCPPGGTHRYYFRVFALDRRLDLKAGADRKQLNAAMDGHVIAKGELMGRYSRR